VSSSVLICLSSQGHAAPVLYAAWAEAGYINPADLLNLRKIDSDLEGHPTPVRCFAFLNLI
jgi:transketolase N-terminal domain/subunit